MSQSVTRYITAVSAGADWTNPTNAEVEDGSLASNGNVGPGGGGHTASQLIGTGCGFNIPSTAVIDGIKLEAKVSSGFSSDYFIQVQNNTKASSTTGQGSFAAASEPAGYNQTWPSTLSWLTWGGATDLWGRTDWTPADINASSFGGSISAFCTHSTDTISVDSMRVTVFWHAAPADVPKDYLYQVFDHAGKYLGLLPNVISEFGFAQEVNTAGTQITIECAVTADVAGQAPNVLTDEAGNVLTDEANNPLTDEGQLPPVGLGTSTYNALIRNGNTIKVWEYGYWNPNGIAMFIGQIQRWEADFGGSGGKDTVKILCYSDGRDLDNYLMRGNPYTLTGDVTQSSQNTTDSISQGGGGFGGAGFNYDGQTWTVGAGVTNLAAISLYLNGTATVTVTVYDSPGKVNVLGASTQNVSVGGATEIQFQFANPLTVVAGSQYYFEVTVAAGQSITIYLSNANPYSGGVMYNYFSGGSTSAFGSIAGSDLYFKTFSGTGSTSGSFTSQDPTTGMAEAAMNDYIARGGLVTYSSSSIQATGLSLTIGYNTNTVLEFLQLLITTCPSGFYWYVDLGTDLLTIKQASTTADVVLTKGYHIESFTLVTTIENLKNQAYFTGGTVSGSNIYVQSNNAASLALYGPRLDRPSNNHVTDTTTARQVAAADIAVLKDEQYQTVVAIVDRKMDTTTLKPGVTIGFNGFGTFIDSLVMQIVRREYSPDGVRLTLGRLPKRLHPTVDTLLRQLIAQQTIANPSTPS